MSNERARRRKGEPACALVAIGMSSGALVPLRTLLTALPRAFSAGIVIAHHVAAGSILPELIEGWCDRPARFAKASASVLRGSIHVCPVQHHIVMNADCTLSLSASERVAYVRPSIDWFFESVAASYGARAIAVVLSGANGDGARGAERVARGGGRVLVQHPDTCTSPEMPMATIAAGVAHAVLPVGELAGVLVEHAARIERGTEPGWLTPFARVASA